MAEEMNCKEEDSSLLRTAAAGYSKDGTVVGGEKMSSLIQKGKCTDEGAPTTLQMMHQLYQLLLTLLL